LKSLTKKKNSRPKTLVADSVAEFPKPVFNTGLGVFPGKKEIYLKNGKFESNVAVSDLRRSELLPYFLRYALDNLDEDGCFDKTAKQIMLDMGIPTEDKAQKVRKLAVEQGFLINAVKRSFKLNKPKIDEYLGRTDV
jgi:hypothetical protein